MSWAWWDWPLTWLTTHRPSVLWHCWLGHVTCKIVSEISYNVSSGTLNPTIQYQWQWTSRFVTKRAISSCPAPRAFLYATIVPPITIDQRKPTVDLPQINGPLCLLVGIRVTSPGCPSVPPAVAVAENSLWRQRLRHEWQSDSYWRPFVLKKNLLFLSSS